MEPAGLLPMSPTQLPPITFKTTLPPLPKSLPLLKEETKVKKLELPPISPISEAPPTSKLPPLPSGTKLQTLPSSKLPTSSKLPPLPTSMTKTSFPPFIPTERIKTGAEAIVVASPLAVEARKTRKEQFEKIEKEVEKKEATILGVSEDIKSLMGSLKPLSSAPIFEKETVKSKMPVSMPKVPETSLPPITSPIRTTLPPLSSKTSLEIAQEGVKTAKLAEPEAAFQKEAKAGFQKKVSKSKKLPAAVPKSKKPPAAVPKSSLKTELPPPPPLTGLRTLAFPTGDGESLSVVASPANLPSKPSPEGTPKIRIPKIKASPVRPSPMGRIKKTGGKISFPTTSTIIQPIAISSPSAVSVSKVKVAKVPEADIMENIKTIDLNKLSAERSAKGKTYSVAELKTIAGGLDLTKSGSKKDLVERIKAAILKVNPNAQFNE